MLETPLTEVRKLNKNHKEALERLGLTTVRDLLLYYPTRYDDFSNITPIEELQEGEKQSVQGVITSIDNIRTKNKRMMLTKAIIQDKTDSLAVVWFRQPYLKKYFKKGDFVTLVGKVEYGYNGLQLTNPIYEKIKEENLHTGKIVPVYSETKGITSKWLRFFISPLLEHIEDFKETLPPEIIKKQKLLSRHQALHQIHFPQSLQKITEAKKRIAFEEMFLIQLNHQSKKHTLEQEKAPKIPFSKNKTIEFIKNLPFELTNDQKKAAWSIMQDIEQQKPMNRLLEGDVGSGKTVVAGLICHLIAEKNYQSIFLAPTEILAKQHFETLKKFLKKHKKEIALYTRTQQEIAEETSSAKEIQEKFEKAEIKILIGTHTLINNITAKNLALAIVDEQHRFGVKQRAALKKINTSKKTPHFLSMTATPIPRTLALALYGDLSISVIKEKPKNRKDIITKMVNPLDREKAYDFIKQKIEAGDQVFVVCPMIEESDKLGVKSVTEEYKKLNEEIFPEIPIGMLHGKLKKDEKEATMNEFKDKKTKILVSTSVIEVGIDVPNATIMMIEGAERFGLSQLHQFRGRVGRGEKQSYCFLFTDSNSENSYERLSALEKTQSGFELSQIDLELRGPGEVYGMKQSGLPDLKMASLTDFELIQKAKEEAENLIKKDPDLKKHKVLKNELKSFKKTVHLE